MFKEMRRQTKRLTFEETEAVLNRAEYGVLTTMGTDGYPYGVPVSHVYHHGSIYFHCAKTGHKLDSIDNDCHVSFCAVVDVDLIPAGFTTKFQSAIVFGQAEEVFEQEKRDGLLALLRKFSSDYIEPGTQYMAEVWEQTRVFRIEIEHMTGKGKR